MSTHFSMDNRTLPPPFFPRFRNADGLLGITLQALFPNDLTCHLPLGVLHLPLEPRTYPPGSLHRWDPSVAESLMVLTSGLMVRNAPGRPEERMRRLGSSFEELGSIPVEELFPFLQELFLPSIVSYLNKLEAVLADNGKEPEEWA